MIKTRLSVMMFLQYFVWGVWFVTMGTYPGRDTAALHRVRGGRGVWRDGDRRDRLAVPSIGIVADRLFSE